MKIAYADPPYLGCCSLYGHYHPDGLCWDDPETHRLLIKRLCSEFPDGWALSMSETSRYKIETMCRELGNVYRVGIWVKPFASFKPNINPAYAFEPVIFRGGRKRGRDLPTVRDWIAENITLEKGLPGAKPLKFCYWLFEMLGMQLGDDFHDLFSGTGIVTQAWSNWNKKMSMRNLPMFE